MVLDFTSRDPPPAIGPASITYAIPTSNEDGVISCF